MSNRFQLVAVLMIVLGATSRTWAKPAHKQALADYFGPFLVQKLNNCQMCHLPDSPDASSEATDKPHNPFGGG